MSRITHVSITALVVLTLARLLGSPNTFAAEADRDIDAQSNRLLTSRVLDPHGQPVPEANVTVITAGKGDSAGKAEVKRLKTDAKGQFSFKTAPQRDVGLIVQSYRGAVARLVMPYGADRLPEIHLMRGSEIHGRVMDRAGKPIKGCIVFLESDDHQSVSTELNLGVGSLMDIRNYRVTDDQGHFKFPPLLGDFRVYLASRDRVFEPGSEEFKKAVDPPPVVPVNIRLDAPGVRHVTLMEAPTSRVRGVVRNQQGQPIAGVQIEHLLPPQTGLSYLTMGTTKTDAEGKYTLTIPLPLAELVLSASTWFDREKKTAFEPWVTSVEHRTYGKYAHKFRLPHPAGDIEGLDWTLMPRGEKPEESDATGGADGLGADGVDPALIELEKLIAATREQYRKAREAAKTDKERESAEDLDPRPLLVRSCLDFEQKHRGTRSAIGALHYVMRAAASSTDKISSDARDSAIQLLREHYVAHADVDLLINELTAGDMPLEGESLLRKIAAESPHDYVRAEALFQLAELLQNQASTVPLYEGTIERLEALIPVQMSERTRQWMRDQVEYAKRLQAKFADLDPDQQKREAERIYDQVIARYMDVRAPHRQWDGPADVRLIYMEDEPTFRRWSAAERADIKRFQLTKLQLGHPAPILEGTDLYHQRIALSDFGGKVVVLIVTDNTVGDQDMYQRARELQEKFKGQPFVLLNIVPTDGSGGYSVREIVRQTNIQWPIIRDTPGSGLARRWGKVTTPEAYLIDKQGFIRYHEWTNAVSPAMVEKVREMLNPQEQL